MRLLHTSDWHLGRRLHGADLTCAHEAWVDHVVEVVRAEQVDVLLVAGDVFDRAIPPVEALRTWEQALERVVAAGARVVVSSGNHDSPVRLGAHAGLLAASGVHVRCDPARVAEPVVLHDDHGPVAFYPVPYLEPTLTAGTLARMQAPGEPAVEVVARSQQGVVARATRLAAADARAAGRPRTVAMAHTWVAGVRPEDRSDSEREIGCCSSVAAGAGGGADAGAGDDATGAVLRAPERVGTVDRVATGAFEGFSYSALGHLHGPQTLAPALRYSGSPVAFSFSERHHRKGSWLVEIDAAGTVRVERVEAPVHRRLSQLSGTLADLLTDPRHAPAEADHVKAVLTDPARPADAMRRLQERFPHAVALEWAPEGRAADLPHARRLATAVSDTAVATGFVAHVRGTPATAAEEAVLDAAFAAVARAGTEHAVAPAAGDGLTDGLLDELHVADPPADADEDLLGLAHAPAPRSGRAGGPAGPQARPERSGAA